MAVFYFHTLDTVQDLISDLEDLNSYMYSEYKFFEKGEQGGLSYLYATHKETSVQLTEQGATVNFSLKQNSYPQTSEVFYGPQRTYNTEEKLLTIHTDPFGTTPIFISVHGGRPIISSHTSIILKCHPDLAGRMLVSSITEYLNSHFILGTRHFSRK